MYLALGAALGRAVVAVPGPGLLGAFCCFSNSSLIFSWMLFSSSSFFCAAAYATRVRRARAKNRTWTRSRAFSLAVRSDL